MHAMMKAGYIAATNVAGLLQVAPATHCYTAVVSNLALCCTAHAEQKTENAHTCTCTVSLLLQSASNPDADDI